LIGLIALFFCSWPIPGLAQQNGTLRGVVTLQPAGVPLHNAMVSIVELKRFAETDEQGAYEFQGVSPGTYKVLARMHGVPNVVQSVDISPGGTTIANFQLTLSGIREEITVTASGDAQTTFEAFQSVATLDSLDLAQRSPTTLGEALEGQLGVAKRSFGPGTTRPVIRGFDGDRVLVLQDGLRTGSLSSQSGDHGEPLDVLTADRLEVVRGPATLLYGSNAIGGVVNAVTEHEHPHRGLHGYVTGLAGSTNDQAGVSGGLTYGLGKWLFIADGNGQRTSDYDTPIGKVINSETRAGGGSGGLGRYSNNGFFNLNYGYVYRRYGIPTPPDGGEGEIDGRDIRRRVRFSGGLHNLKTFVSGFNLSLEYSNNAREELVDDEVETSFSNKLVEYRGVFDQRRRGRFSGSFGVSGFHRDYKITGEELLAPPTRQNNFAVFGLEEITFERIGLQFGGRLEHNGYNPDGLRDRSFTGLSGAAGLRVGLWEGGAFVVNYTHSTRAPALEELYNNGPHPGNLAFEIGNPDLRRERGDGLDVSLRHSSSRLRAEANFYYYNIQDFVFLAPTGEIEEGLTVANYAQADTRYLGAEVGLDIGLHRYLWLNTGLDYVDAELKDSGVGLPRIPPLRGRLGFDVRYKGLSIRPEAILARDQSKIFPTETRTAGYTVFNLPASYTIAQTHAAHVFSVEAFNLGDRLYRNHLSFIKEFAPEIGRGVRFSYSVRFF
jgi:iron complex outermembrane receptor protein